MIRKFTIGFLFTTLLLAASEYIFLHEVFSARRLMPLAASLGGIVLAAILFLLFFAYYHKLLKDS